MKCLSLIFLIGLISFTTDAQSSVDIDRVITALLGETPIEEDLQELCDEIGGRVTGSTANMDAVLWGHKKFEEAGVKSWKQEFTMPVLWLPESTTAQIIGDIDFVPTLVAKYQTPAGLYGASLVDVGYGTLADFEKQKDKIIDNFILVETDLCMDINGLFAEYTQAANVEELAEKFSAKGIIFMASRPKGLLYRFITSKGVDNTIPQFVMVREDAKRCARNLRNGKSLNINTKVKARTGGEFTSMNVLAEIKGSEYPNEVIVIGAHLDSWAMGTGANDNGCNVSLMIDIARQMKKLDIIPKRTIRFALWNGEEQGYFGSWAYTKEYEKELDNHKLALSVDIGSGPIIGFFTNGNDEMIPILDEALKSVDTLGNYLNINNPIVGTDNFDFMLQGIPNLVANHKPANYGINYHAASDTYDKVDLKSLKKNSAIIAAAILSYANRAEVLDRDDRSAVEMMIKKHKLEFPMRMFNVWDPWINYERGIQK